AYGVWETRNFRRMKGVADELSAQLMRKEIEIGRLATVDELTGLYTRREFDRKLELEFARSKRHAHALSLMLIEVDDITTLGEGVGSLNKGYLMSEVSAILRGTLRANDTGCRYTNEVLALLLPETVEANALAVATRLRDAVGKRDFLVHIAPKVRLTVSQGIATLRDEFEAPDALVRAAETALVDARTQGIDRIATYAPKTAPDAPDTGTGPFRLAS
ncbi:MAG TPA: GGDEF domain-containing protein, partial [Dehalococcoidia bacterium]